MVVVICVIAMSVCLWSVCLVCLWFVVFVLLIASVLHFKASACVITINHSVVLCVVRAQIGQQTFLNCQF